MAVDGGGGTEEDGQNLTRRTQFGGAEGDRTPDLRIANATLSQLSYGPFCVFSASPRARRTMGMLPCPVKRGSTGASFSRARATRVLRDLRTPAADATVLRQSPPPGPGLMYSFLHLVNTLITIFIWLLIAQAVLSWLLAFGVVNRYNRVVASANDFLWRITEPALRPIRSFLPNLGGIDISPVILILLLYFLRDLMFEYLA